LIRDDGECQQDEARACCPRDAGRVDDEGVDEGHAAEQEDAAPPDDGDTPSRTSPR
jgi:hypothetical protein